MVAVLKRAFLLTCLLHSCHVLAEYQNDCAQCNVSRTCDTWCEGTCALPRRCPSWMQGEWQSAEGDQSAWSMKIIGNEAFVTFLAVPIFGKIYCGKNLSAASTFAYVGHEWDRITGLESSSAVNVAVEWDLQPETPVDMDRALIRGVIRLGRTNLQALPQNHLESISSKTTTSLDVMIAYGWRGHCYEDGGVDPRYPPLSSFRLDEYDDGGFTEGGYRYDTLACTTSALTYSCPHWLHGDWSGSMTTIQDKEHTVDTWNISILETGVSVSSFSDKSFVYNARCNKIQHDAGDIGQWQIDFHDSLGSSPPHRLRGVFRVPRFGGNIVHVGAPFNWCQRPNNVSHPSIYAFEDNEPVPFRETGLMCMVKSRQHVCTTYLRGRWKGFLLDSQKMSLTNLSAAINATRTQFEFTDHAGQHYTAQIRCGLETHGFSIPGATPMSQWPETSLDFIYSSPIDITAWTSHANFKFNEAYNSFSIILGAPGKCARPLTMAALPSYEVSGFNMYTFTCAIDLLDETCPEWMAGSHASSGMRFDVTNNRSMVRIETGEPMVGTILCQTVNESIVLVDIIGQSPSHFLHWVKRAVALRSDDKGTVVLLEAPAGLCDRPPTDSHAALLQVLLPFKRTVMPCTTPVLSEPCPGWLQGNWTTTATYGAQYGVRYLTILGNVSIVGNTVSGITSCGPYGMDNVALVDIRPLVSSKSTFYQRKLRAIATFHQENGTVEFTFGPYGWCIRPDPSEPLVNGPFSTIVLSCTVDRMEERCPPWIDGRWRVVADTPLSLSDSRLTIYNMTIDGNSSTLNWKHEHSLQMKRQQRVLCSSSTFDQTKYTSAVVDIDVIYETNQTVVIERGQIGLNGIDPVSKIHFEYAPYNWCYRPVYYASRNLADKFHTTRTADGSCVTPLGAGICPIWLQGHWKFFSSRDNGTSSKWVIDENSITNRFYSATAVGTISCSSSGLDDPLSVRLDIIYSGPGEWTGRIMRTLVRRIGNKQIGVIMPPIGWCSPAPDFFSSSPPVPYAYSEGKLVEVPSPPSYLVVATVQESMDINVEFARSSIKTSLATSSSDHFSPITAYIVEYDVMGTQQMLCDNHTGALGACCRNNGDCVSGLCSTDSLSCTMRCNSSAACADATGGQSIKCVQATWLPKSIYFEQTACDTSISVSPAYNLSFCADVCNLTVGETNLRSTENSCIFNVSSVSMGSMHPCSSSECNFDGMNYIEASLYLKTNPCCAKNVREYCSNSGILDPACYSYYVRTAVGMSGRNFVTPSDKTLQNFAILLENLNIGSKYHFRAFAVNEIGMSNPMLSIPREEIPRALPPPPPHLQILQVEPVFVGNNTVTLEQAKESLDIQFETPAFDNGDEIIYFLLEWDRRVQFDGGMLSTSFPCSKQFDPELEGDLSYGKCSSSCDAVGGRCTHLGACPFDSNSRLCYACSNKSHNFGVSEFQTNNCISIIQEEAKLINPLDGTCKHVFKDIQNYLTRPFENLLSLVCSTYCMKRMTLVFADINAHQCGTVAQSSVTERAATRFACDVEVNGDNCTSLLQNFKLRIEAGEISCQILQDYKCCAKSIASMFANISSTLSSGFGTIVTLTEGAEHFQTTSTSNVIVSNASLMVEIFGQLYSLCPKYKDESRCNNTAMGIYDINANSSCADATRKYCQCENPFDMGCTRYDFAGILKYKPDGSALLPVADKHSYTYRVSGLEKRTMYRVRVSSINAVGQGLARMSKALPALMIPSRPSYANASLVTWKSRKDLSTVIQIKFIPAFDDRMWTDSFDIEYSTENLAFIPEQKSCNTTLSLACVSITSRSTPFGADLSNTTFAYVEELPGMVPGSEYFFRVYSVIAGRRGRSKTSNPMSIVPPRQTPNAPLGVDVVHINGSTLSVAWSAPDFDGGASIRSYEVSYQLNAMNNSFVRKDNCTRRKTAFCGAISYQNMTSSVMPTNWQVLISDLFMGKYYNISISACNVLGCGIVAMHEPVKTMQPPEEPTLLAQGVYNSSAIEISYSKPESDGGDMIQSYLIEWDKLLLVHSNQSNFSNVSDIRTLENSSREVNVFRFYGKRHEYVTSNLFKVYSIDETPSILENCSCLEIEGKALYGECCCQNSDCLSGICNSHLGSCTIACTLSHDCKDSDVTPGEQFCTNMTWTGEQSVCTVRCPFNWGVYSPCNWQNKSSESPCKMDDFAGSWTRSQIRGYKNPGVPTAACALYISTYCNIISPSDSACSWRAVRNILHDIPKCKARIPPAKFSGIRATSLISGLDTNGTYVAKISACNRAGCGRAVSVGIPLVPKPQIIISEKHQCIVEGKEKDFYTIQLNSRPTSPVHIDINGQFRQLFDTRRHITFGSNNWTEIIRINVTAKDDNVDEDDIMAMTLLHSIRTNDVSYSLFHKFVPSPNVLLQIHDNDYAGVLVWKTNLTVSETGHTSYYKYQLRSRPVYDVLLSTNTTADVVLTPPTLLFDAGVGWGQSKLVSVIATDDNFDEEDIVVNIVSTHAITLDTMYRNIFIPTVSVSVVDDDTAGVSLSTNETLEANEGKSVVYDISLTAQPRHPVVVVLSLDPMREGLLNYPPEYFIQSESMHSFSTTISVLEDGQFFVRPTSLIFDVGETDWMIPKAFTLYAVDDSIDKGNKYSVLVRHVSLSNDEIYDGRTSIKSINPILYVEISDNDLAGILVSRKNLVVTEDGTRTDSYTLELETAPTAPVLITLYARGNQAMLSPTTVVFTSSNFNIPVRINASSYDDNIAEEAVHFDIVRHKVFTNDTIYGAIVLSDIDLRIIDAAAIVDTSKPPNVMFIVQSDAGEELNVHLDRPAFVQRVGIEFHSDCENFFEAKSAKSFGIGSFCYWKSDVMLKVREGSKEPFEGVLHVAPGTKLTLLGGVIRSTLTSVIFAEGIYSVLPRVPPPRMSHAYLSATGSEIFVNFTGSCWDGFYDGITSEPCASIFHNGAMFGLDAHCSWVSVCLLRIELGWGSSIQPAFGLERCGSCKCETCKPTPAFINYDGYSEICSSPNTLCSDVFCFCEESPAESEISLCPDMRSLRLMSGAVRPLRQSIVSASGCIKIDVPENTVRPVALLDSPQLASTCNDVVFDGTNSITSGGGRDNITWVLQGVTTGFHLIDKGVQTKLRTIAKAFSKTQSLILTISSELLVDVFQAGFTQIQAQLSITNVFGDTSTQSNFVIMTSQPYPTVIILANKTLSVNRRDKLELHGDGQSACAMGVIKFKWTYLSDANIKADRITFALDNKVIKIPPYTLLAGKSYVFKFSATLEGHVNYASVIVNVARGKVVAAVGAKSRQISTNQTVVLDASHSHDEDFDGIGLPPLVFSWKCSRAGGLYCNVDPGLFAYASNDGSILTIPPRMFVSNAQYRFTLTVTSGGRNAVETVDIWFVDGALPQVNILEITEKINPSSKLVLHGSILPTSPKSDFHLQWKETTRILDKSAGQFGRKVYGSPLDRASLVILPNILSSGRSYTFRLSAVSNFGETFAEISFIVNKPPTSGYIETNPSAGMAGVTVFSTHTGSWVDDSEDLPFHYSFFYTEVGSNASAPHYISESSGYLSRIRHMLPSTRNGTVYEIRVVVSDAFGASGTTSKTRHGMPVLITMDAMQIFEQFWDTQSPGYKEGSALELTNRLSHTDMTFYILALSSAMNGVSCDDTDSIPRKCNTERVSMSRFLNKSCDDDNTTRCPCEDGWDGPKCNMLSLELHKKTIYRQRMLQILKSGFARSLPSISVVEQQVVTTAALLGSVYEVNVGLASEALDHVGYLFETIVDENLALTANNVIVSASLDLLTSITKSAKLHPRVATNETGVGRVGTRSAVGEHIVATASRLSRALLRMNSPGEFPVVQRTDELSLWAMREQIKTVLDIHILPTKGEMNGPHIFIKAGTILLEEEKENHAVVDVCVLSYNMHFDGSMSPSIVSIEIFDANGDAQARPLTLESLEVPVKISLPLTPSPSANVTLERSPICRFWNATSSRWSMSGVFTSKMLVTDKGQQIFECESTHLSQFALTQMSHIPPADKINELGRVQHIVYRYDNFNFSAVTTYGIYMGLTVLVLIGALRLSLHSHNEYKKNSELYFLLLGSTAKPPKNPSLVGTENRFYIRPLSILFFRLIESFNEYHILFVSLNILFRFRSLTLPDAFACTGGFLSIFACSAYLVGNNPTITLQPSGRSFVNLEPDNLVFQTSIVSTAAIFALRWLRLILLNRSSIHGNILVNRLGWSVGQLRLVSNESYVSPTAMGMSLYYPANSPAARWRAFECLYMRCVSFARKSNISYSPLQQSVSVYSYEKYVVNSILHGGNPLSRKFYNFAIIIQAQWRGFSVRRRKFIFESHHHNILGAREALLAEFGLPVWSQRMKSFSLTIQAIQVLLGLLLCVSSLTRVVFLFEAPYGASGAVTGAFLVNTSVFCMYLVKHTSGKILYTYPILMALTLAIGVAYLRELEGILTLSNSNWGDLRNIWVDASKSSEATIVTLVENIQSSGRCCGFANSLDFPVGNCVANATMATGGCVTTILMLVDERMKLPRIILAVSMLVQFLLLVACATFMHAMPTNLSANGFITKSDVDKLNAFKEVLFLNDNGKLVASTINMAKVVLDSAALKIQGMVRAYLGRVRHMRLLELAKIRSHHILTKTHVCLFLLAMIAWHSLCAFLTLLYCVKFDPARNALWETTYMASMAIVFFILLPGLLVFAEIVQNRWWYDIYRHCKQWSEWTGPESDMI